jgi:hypothetical protein
MTERPLPTNKYILFRITNAQKSRQKLAVLRVISEFFFLTPQGYSNDRFEEELTKAEARRTKAQKGAKSRWKGHAPSNAPSNATGNARGDAIHIHTPEPTPLPLLNIMQKLGISLSLWQQYKTMREGIHRPVVPGAEDLVLAELLKLQEQSHNPVEILQDAIRTSSYNFPNGKGKTNGHIESFQERTQRKSQDVLAEVRGNLDPVVHKVERVLPKPSRK